jgi:hypothetical protein
VSKSTGTEIRAATGLASFFARSSFWSADTGMTDRTRTVITASVMESICFAKLMCSPINFDELVKSQKNTFVVIPVKTGIQLFQPFLDSGFRRSDGIGTFYKTINFIVNNCSIYVDVG